MMAINLRNSIRRDSKAKCPECGEIVDCCQLEYMRVGNYLHRSSFWHPECDTTWQLDIITGEVTRNEKPLANESTRG